MKPYLGGLIQGLFIGSIMKRKPGLLFVVNALSTGGAEVFILRLAQALKSHWQIFITTVYPDQNQPAFTALFLETTGATLLPSSPPNPTGLFKRWQPATRGEHWKKLLKKHQIKAVNSHLFSADVFTLHHLRPQGNFFWLITTHSSPFTLINQLAPENERESYHQSMSNLFKEADQVFTVSSVCAQLNETFPMKHPAKQVWLGLEAKAHVPPVHPSAFHFGMVGRSTPEKGWEIALEAFSQLKQKFQDLRFTAVIPPGTYTDQLMAKYKNLQGLVFKTDVSDACKVIAEWHMGLLPSLRESTPYTIIECLAMGRPVLASNRGDIALMLQTGTPNDTLAGALIDDQEDGKPSVIDLTRKMEYFITHPEAYQRACDAVPEAFKKFDMSHCAAQYQHFLSTSLQ